MRRFFSIDLNMIQEIGISPNGFVFLDLLHHQSDGYQYIEIDIKGIASLLSIKASEIKSIIAFAESRGLISINENGLARTTESFRSLVDAGFSKKPKNINKASVNPAHINIITAELPSVPILSRSLEVDFVHLEDKVSCMRANPIDYLQDSDRVVNEFTFQRKKLQPNFNIDLCEGRFAKSAYIVMREHLCDNTHVRTPRHYFDAIRWLFTSQSKEALFWRKSIGSISKLIQHYDAIELASMTNIDDQRLAEEAKILVEVMRKHGASEEEIKKELHRKAKNGTEQI